MGSAGELIGARAELEPGNGGSDQRQLAIVPLPDGTVSAVWQHRSILSPQIDSIYTRHFDATLQALTPPTELAGTAQAAPFPVSAAAVGANLALAWTATSADGRPELRTAVIAPEASTVGASASVETTFDVSFVRVLPFGAGEFGVVWQAVQAYPRGTNASLYLQRHAATGAATGAPTELNRRGTAWVSEITGAGVTAGTGVAVAGGADGHVVATFQSAGATQPNQSVFGR